MPHSSERRIRDLQTLEGALATLVTRCATSTGKVACPLIDSRSESEIDRRIE